MTPTARALIAAARAGLDPDPSAAPRIRAKLDARLAAPAATGISLKLLATLAIVGTVATVGALSSPSAQPTATPAPVLAEAAPADTHLRIIAASPESPPPARHADPALGAHAIGSPAIGTHALRTPAEVSLAREVALIDRAMTSLRAGQPDAALTAISLYHHETADRGQLLEDASAIDIEASCALHLDVSTKLAAFDRAWPSSAQRSRLSTVCP